MDIGSNSSDLAKRLSNFKARHFFFSKVECSSLEGLIQSLKFDKPHIQEVVCKLIGLKAKFRGKKRNKAWKRVQKLWWKGQEFDRHGEEYQELLDRIFLAVACQDERFRRDLIATGSANLTHSIGKRKKSDTVLTEQEFCSRLMKIRAKLVARQPLELPL